MPLKNSVVSLHHNGCLNSVPWTITSNSGVGLRYNGGLNSVPQTIVTSNSGLGFGCFHSVPRTTFLPDNASFSAALMLSS